MDYAANAEQKLSEMAEQAQRPQGVAWLLVLLQIAFFQFGSFAERLIELTERL